MLRGGRTGHPIVCSWRSQDAQGPQTMDILSRISIVLGLAVLAFAGPVSASNASSRFHSCGSYYRPGTDIGYEQILVRNIRCLGARMIVRRWVNDSRPLPYVPRGWRCDDGVVRGRLFVNHCRRGHQRLVLKQGCPPGTCQPTPAVRRRYCGDLRDVIVSKVIAVNLSCRASRSIARHYVARAGCYRNGCVVGRYHCHRSVQGYESYHARCVHGSRVVTFDYGA